MSDDDPSWRTLFDRADHDVTVSAVRESLAARREGDDAEGGEA